MWMIVMFDLPVVTKADRKEYTRFRNHLLDNGFDMSQFSVYERLVSSKDRVKQFERRIAAELPKNGKVQIITITDKQYQNIKSYYGQSQFTPDKPDQLHLF
ncbi:MAG: CRISPR-associated endonuclease Cas2 [Spirochaetales bacterium]|nr:MAG: CRISPR-associated endonuclease Cas2 [Spirochaetales bacterium]